MPIRFFCEHCRQMLKIGTSKMGSVVDCPRCRKAVVVPPQSTPQAEQLYQMLKSQRSAGVATPPAEDHALSEPTAPESAWDELGGNVDDADLSRWIDELWANAPVEQQDASPFQPAITPVSLPVAEEEVALFALQKRYKLTVTLLYVSSAIAFFIGIIFGIALYAFILPSSSTSQHFVGNDAPINEIAGTLYYLNRNGERQADADAVIIVLPKDRTPSPLFSCQGLRPGDAVNHDTLQLIHEMGGIYERTDAYGSFSLQYREGVRYYVILISAHQARTDGVLKPSLLQTLRRYFHNPDQFAGYCLSIDEYEWSGGKYSLRHTFEAAD
jgi:hypothetical protein